MTKGMTDLHDDLEATMVEALEVGTILGYAWTAVMPDGRTIGGHAVSGEEPVAAFIPGVLTTGVALSHLALMEKFTTQTKEVAHDPEVEDEAEAKAEEETT